MRVNDLAAPAVPAHVIPPGQPSARWKAKPIVALEWLPQSTWDAADPASVWDDPTPRVWDDPATAIGYTDVWCDTAGLEIVHGEPDERELFPPSRATLTLYDPTGLYRTRTVDGRLSYFAPGRRLSVLAEIAGVRWWLFNGRVATWHEQAGDMVEIVAYAAPANLAQDPGRKWSPGVDGERLAARAAAIVAGSGVVGVTVRADAGDATLAVPPADRVAALEWLQQAAWSDGGIVFADADDTLRVRDRRWRNGRDDQPARLLVLSDNVCIVGNTIVWDAEPANDDEWLAGRVVLSNLAGLVATASNPAEMIDPSLTFSHADVDVWKLQTEGNALAAAIANDRGAARLAVSLARVYLHDPTRDQWQQIIDLRLGDRIAWQHEYPGAELLDVDTIAATVRHLITPDEWLVEIETTPATGYRAVYEWDTTSLTWDTADPTGVWR